MADFEAPSFSLGLDLHLCDSNPQITPLSDDDTHPSSSNHFSISSTTFNDKHDEFETLVVDDSEPEYPDSHPKPNRLRRGSIIGVTMFSSSASATAEAHSTAVVDDGDIAVFSSLEDWRTDHVKKKQCVLHDREPVSTGCNNMRFQSTDSDLDSNESSVGRKCNGSDPNLDLEKSDLHQYVNREQTVLNTPEAFPNCFHYFFHDDRRIQELVRIRLSNFSPLGNMLDIDLEPSTSNIDYMGQFRFSESLKQAARTTKHKESSTSRKISTKLNEEEESEGWVNPKLGVGKVTTKGTRKRKVHTARQTAGHWLTGSNGKKVYVGKSGKELTGPGAYIQYKKDSGSGFKNRKGKKRKLVTKKRRRGAFVNIRMV